MRLARNRQKWPEVAEGDRATEPGRRTTSSGGEPPSHPPSLPPRGGLAPRRFGSPSFSDSIVPGVTEILTDRAIC